MGVGDKGVWQWVAIGCNPLTEQHLAQAKWITVRYCYHDNLCLLCIDHGGET